MSLYQLYSSCSFNYCQLDTIDRCNVSSVHLLAVLLTTVACKQLKGVLSLQYVNVVVSTTMSCKVCYWKLYILGFSFAIITNISCNFKLHKILKKEWKTNISFTLSLKHLFTSLPRTLQQFLENCCSPTEFRTTNLWIASPESYHWATTSFYWKVI